MNADFFADSNVLVYAYNDGEPRKQALAQGLLRQPGRCISTQVLQEFCNVLKRRIGFDWPTVASSLDEVSKNFGGSVSVNSPVTVQDALRIAAWYQLSFYDSLTLAAALECGCKTLYSEDMHHGLIIDGVLTIRNPFI